MLKEQALPQALKLYIYMVIERLDLTNLTRTAENRDNFQKLNSNSARWQARLTFQYHQYICCRASAALGAALASDGKFLKERECLILITLHDENLSDIDME